MTFSLISLSFLSESSHFLSHFSLISLSESSHFLSHFPLISLILTQQVSKHIDESATPGKHSYLITPVRTLASQILSSCLWFLNIF